MTALTTDFWTAREVHQHILQLAQARRAGPEATLLVAIAHALTTVPPRVCLPPIVGGRMSLNFFAALVGPSGGGKGAAENAAAAGIRFTSGRIEPLPLGSGEGISRTYRPIGTKTDEPNPVTTALLSAPEVDSLAALTARTGSTLSAELRKLYSGETIGAANAGKDTRVIVPAGTYRAALLVGVQPLRAGVLLDGASGGLPQRFAWAMVTDPDAPDEPPNDPGVWTVRVPAWTRRGARHLDVVDDGPIDLAVPERAVQDIQSHRLAVLREQPDVDPLAGHRMLTRLKVAAGLMALEGRTLISDEDWELSRLIMDSSDAAREICQRSIRDHARTINTARALATADREEIISDRKLQRCKVGILRRLDRQGGAPIQQRELRRGLKSDIRDYYDAATVELLAENLIIPGHDGRAPTYMRSTWTEPSTPPNQQKHHEDHPVHVDPRPPRRRKRSRGKNRPHEQTAEGQPVTETEPEKPTPTRGVRPTRRPHHLTAAPPAKRQKPGRSTDLCPICRWPEDRGHAENCASA